MLDQELEFKLQQLDQLANQWKRFFALYRKIAKPGESTEKDEADFADLATHFARVYVPIATRVGIRVEPGSSVISMVSDVPDAEAVRALSEMQRRKFESDWRANNAALNQKLGELQLLREELKDTSAFVYYTRRLFAHRAVQWIVGASVIIILLGVFGFFRILQTVLLELVKSVR